MLIRLSGISAILIPVWRIWEILVYVYFIFPPISTGHISNYFIDFFLSLMTLLLESYLPLKLSNWRIQGLGVYGGCKQNTRERKSNETTQKTDEKMQKKERETVI